MSDHKTLHERLNALGTHLESFRKSKNKEQNWHDGHARTEKEFNDRYREMKARLDEDVLNEAELGHHVSDFEYSLREWFEDLNYETE